MEKDYKGAKILVRTAKLPSGGWKWDVTIFRREGSTDRGPTQYGDDTYPAEKGAELAGLEFGMRMVDEDERLNGVLRVPRCTSALQ